MTARAEGVGTPAVSEFDADATHPWAIRWRIPRVATSYPRRQYEVALVVPTGVHLKIDGETLEPSEIEAEIIGSYIDYRRASYREHWQRQMLKRPFDIDDGTNTVVLAKTAHGWKYRRLSHQFGLWPFHWANPEKQAEFPPTAVGLVALLDHINHDGARWTTWKTEHPLPAEEGTQP